MNFLFLINILGKLKAIDYGISLGKDDLFGGFGGYFMLGETVHNLFSSGEFLQ